MYSDIICEILEGKSIFCKSDTNEIFYLLDLKFDDSTIIKGVCSEFILGDSVGMQRLSVIIKSDRGEEDKLFTYLDIHCINSTEEESSLNKFQVRGYVKPTQGLGVANMQGTIYRFLIKYYNQDSHSKSIVHCIAKGETARRLYAEMKKGLDGIFTLEGFIKDISGKIEIEVTSILDIKQMDEEVG